MDDSTNSSEVSEWATMVDWIVKSLPDKPVALVLDMGPNIRIANEHQEVVCAQIQLLGDGVLMLRRSRTIMRRFTAGGLPAR
ncbi:hypothetical protein [Rhodococcus sp. 24CO]|uniref:hypothetical protein n=1 Tax=Rhodococcus sp. 24CO TaxID=3117460 RepID=UPI003D327B75